MGDGGKGSRPRPFSVDQKTFDSHWDNIFKKNPQPVKLECGDCGWTGTQDEVLLDENFSDCECPSCGSRL